MFWVALFILLVGGVFSFRSHGFGGSAVTENPATGCLVILAWLGVNACMWVGSKAEFGNMSFLFAMMASGLTGILYVPMLGGIVSTALTKGITPQAPRKPRRTFVAAENLEVRGDLEGAEAEYRRLLDKNPDDHEAHLRLAELLARRGDHAGAAREFESALERGTKMAGAVWCKAANRLIDIYMTKLNERGRAAELLEAIVSRCPDTDFAKYARERLERMRAG